MGIGFNFIGRKIGEEIKKFTTMIFEARKDDNRNALLYTPAGDNSVPLDDERLILVKVDGTGKYIAVAVLTQSQGAKPGEKILFARDPDGAIVSKISMLNDGSVTTEADGDITEKTKKNHATTADENITQEAKKDFSAKADNNATLEATKKTTVKGSDVEVNGKVVIKGGTLECKGVAPPTGSGCLCAMAFCAATGAPQTGEKANAT